MGYGYTRFSSLLDIDKLSFSSLLDIDKLIHKGVGILIRCVLVFYWILKAPKLSLVLLIILTT